jgi:hypothetical protein
MRALFRAAASSRNDWRVPQRLAARYRPWGLVVAGVEEIGRFLETLRARRQIDHGRFDVRVAHKTGDFGELGAPVDQSPRVGVPKAVRRQVLNADLLAHDRQLPIFSDDFPYGFGAEPAALADENRVGVVG